MKNHLLTFLTLLSFSALSQEHEKASNDDLRNTSRVFSITESKNMYVEFSKSKLDQYFLQIKKGKKVNNKKVASSTFFQIDSSFVKKFIEVKYMMAPTPSKCSVFYKLYMRGELLKICKNEPIKIKKIKSLISKISAI